MGSHEPHPYRNAEMRKDATVRGDVGPRTPEGPYSRSPSSAVRSGTARVNPRVSSNR